MAYDEYNHFITIVAGENPEKLMAEYDKKKVMKPFVLYEKKDAEKLRQKYIGYYKAMISWQKSKEGNEDELKENEKLLSILEDQTPERFFDVLTAPYKKDEEGNALSTENPNGKWTSYKMGQFMSVPFMTTYGEERFQERKNKIDWPLVHLNNQDVYIRAWEMVMEGSEPKDEDEATIYENMKNRTYYFSKFGTKENYVASSTAFWGYAFLSEKTGWLELEDYMDQFVWMTNFYDQFIKPLPGNTLITIYECTK